MVDAVKLEMSYSHVIAYLNCGYHSFSPAMQSVKRILDGRTTPIIANYRMNAGFIPRDHWVHGPEGGGSEGQDKRGDDDFHAEKILRMRENPEPGTGVASVHP